MPVVPGTHTFTDGIAPSSEMNSYVRDPIAFLQRKPICKARQATLQSIPSGAFTSITLDAEDVDTDVDGVGGHDNVTNNSRFTARYPGYHSISGGCSFASNVTGRRGVRVAVNGTAVNGSTVVLAATIAASVVVGNDRNLVYLNVGDYVELQAFQDSGGALNTVSTTDSQPRLMVSWESN